MRTYAQCLVTAACIIFSSSVSSYGIAETLATVGGKNITDADFKKEVDRLGPQADVLKTNPQARKRFLDQLITVLLLEEAAQKNGVEKSPEFVERMDMIRRQVLAQQYMEDALSKSVNESAVKDHFKKHKNRFNGEEVCASHILLKKENKATAEKLLADVQKKDADFAALAKANSTDGSAEKGGELGCFGRGQMVPEFEAAAFATKKGAVHKNLVESQFGFHIIKVSDVKPGQEVKIEDVRPQIEEDIKRTAQVDIVERLKKDAKVTVNDKALESVKF